MHNLPQPTRRRLLAAGTVAATGALAAELRAGTRPIFSNTTTPRSLPMRSNTITTQDGTQIYYKDWGTGPVVTFSHGWPLNADAWDGQMHFLARNGFRVIAHDRRGHGRSSQPSMQDCVNADLLAFLRS